MDAIVTDPTANSDATTADGTATVSSTSRPLADFLREGHAPNPTVMLRQTGQNLVILGRHDDTRISVSRDGLILTCPADAPAVPITDPTRQVDLLRRAVLVTAAERQRLVDHTAQLQTAADDADRIHSQVLADIRAYAIARHVDGDICQDGLDRFLQRFGMAAYRPHLTVKYTITGSFEVDRDDGDYASSDIERYLRVDTSLVDDVVDGSGQIDVRVTGVEPFDG